MVRRGSVVSTLSTLVLAVAAPLAAQARGAYLGDLTWPDAERMMHEVPLVIVPFGAGAKEHGPHLPMNADAKVLEYLVHLAVDSRRIVFLNTGIAAATGLPLSIVAREIRTSTGTPTLVVSWDDLETPAYHALERQTAGGHADEIETSISLYLQPQLVHMDRAAKDYGTASAKDYPGYQPGQFSRDSADPAYSRTGLLGDPTLATAEKGKQALEVLGQAWLKALRGFAQAPLRSGLRR